MSVLAWSRGSRDVACRERAGPTDAVAPFVSFSSSPHSPLSKLLFPPYFHSWYVHSRPSTPALTSSDQPRRDRAQAAGPLPLCKLCSLKLPLQHDSLRSAVPRPRSRPCLYRTCRLVRVPRARQRRRARAPPFRARRSSTSPRSSLAARHCQHVLRLGHVHVPVCSLLHSRERPIKREWRRVRQQQQDVRTSRRRRRLDDDRLDLGCGLLLLGRRGWRGRHSLQLCVVQHERHVSRSEQHCRRCEPSIC